MTQSLPASEKFGIFTVGMGAVATTLFAGVEMIRRGLRPAVGSYVEMGDLSDASGASLPLRSAFSFPALKSIEFGGVDLIEVDALASARNCGVLSSADLTEVAPFLATIKAGPGLHDAAYIKTLDALRTRPERTKVLQAEAMAGEFRSFFSSRGISRGVVVLTLSTEAWRPLSPVHATQESFQAGLDANDPNISPSQIYAWAALNAGYPVVNCTPNLVIEVPALRARAEAKGLCLAGSDLKSGQTLMKTVIAAGLAKRLLGVKGWYSTNILGNRDGFVLDEPENFRAKEITKGSVLADILDAKRHPELYAGLEHQVHINYFPPKGDNKEAWDAVQLFGWLGYEMELKINFQCRDSILAAPLVLDLALLIDLAGRCGAPGPQSWLGGYFKSPALRDGEEVLNDFHGQLAAIERQLNAWR